jgi:hypothetical protein
MLRPDERIAWDGFYAAHPRFAGEDISSAQDGPDPPDVICTTVSGRTVGVELTKWVNHDQVTSGRARELLQNSYLKVVGSENEPRPDRIGWVWLLVQPKRIRPADQLQFRSELFALLTKENAKSEPEWDAPQGSPVEDFAGFPVLQKYGVGLWVYPRSRMQVIPAGYAWVMFRPNGGAYTHEWMVQAAIDRIFAKIEDYEDRKLHEQHSLSELHLLCYYCDEALLHNTPIHTIGFGFPELTIRVVQALASDHGVFDRIFIYNPYENCKVVQVYPAENISLTGAA